MKLHIKNKIESIKQSELYSQLTIIGSLFTITFLTSLAYLSHTGDIVTNTNLTQYIAQETNLPSHDHHDSQINSNDKKLASLINSQIVSINIDDPSESGETEENQIIENVGKPANLSDVNLAANSDEFVTSNKNQNNIDVQEKDYKRQEGNIFSSGSSLATPNIGTFNSNNSQPTVRISNTSFQRDSKSNDGLNNPASLATDNLGNLDTSENSEGVEQEITSAEPTLNVLEFKSYYDDPIVCPPLTQFREEWREGAAAIQRQNGCVL